VGDNKETVYEAGIYNLTQQEAPVLVHYGKERTQQWTLVRLKQPEGQDGTSTDGGTPAPAPAPEPDDN
jgi:hypothetical protein